MRGSDPDPHSRLPPDAGRLRVAAGAAVPAGMELGDPGLGVVLRVRADEAGVDGHVAERRSGTEDTHDLPRDLSEVVDVGAREDGDGGVERRVFERQRARIRLDGAHASRPRPAGWPPGTKESVVF